MLASVLIGRMSKLHFWMMGIRVDVRVQILPVTAAVGATRLWRQRCRREADASVILNDTALFVAASLCINTRIVRCWQSCTCISLKHSTRVIAWYTSLIEVSVKATSTCLSLKVGPYIALS